MTFRKLWCAFIHIRQHMLVQRFDDRFGSVCWYCPSCDFEHNA